MYRLIAISSFVLYSTFLSAQVRCLSIPQASPEFAALSRTQEVLIPVVFHIVHSTDEQNVSDQNITSQLLILNQAFSEELQDLSALNPRAHPNVGAVGLKFVLASKGSDGSETDGIVRIPTDMTDIGDQFTANGTLQVKSTDDGGASAWDTDRYVNIWVSERNTSLGYTISATSTSDDVEGIVLDYREVLSNSKTFIHEMGHYLGLLHPWGNRTGCDDEDDGIQDTPFQVDSNFSCSQPEACSQRLEPGNYMDFAEDDCLLFFTKQQAMAMHSHLTRFKEDLINSDACFPANLPDAMEYELFLSDSSLELYFGDYPGPVDVRFFSLNGSLIHTTQLKGENYLNIDTDGIPSGIYLLVISSGEKRRNEKILIF